MASNAAMAHARTLLTLANKADDDPRRTRIDLLQVGNFIAVSSTQNPELLNLVKSIRKFVSNQVIAPEDLNAAVKLGKGWPIIQALPGPVSYFYGAARLVSHAALRDAHLIDTFEKSIKKVGPLTDRVMKLLKTSEKDLFSAGTVVAAEMASKSADFRSRLIAAGKDIQQIVTSDEFPRFEDFQKAVPGQLDWPPLRLGCPPILGGALKERDSDWQDGGGSSDPSSSGSGGAYDGPPQTICEIPSGSTAKDVACVVIAGVVIIYAIADIVGKL